MTGNAGEAERSEHRPITGQRGRSGGLAASVVAVLQLAEQLPAFEDVRAVGEGDRSDLTPTEERQKEQTESVIGGALAAGDAAVWVVAQGLERAARGRWWRSTHDSFSAYAQEKIGRSAVYGRQLRKNAPLALETAKRTGTVPKPSQVKVTRKTEQQHGLDAAVTLYEVVRDVSVELGQRATAENLRAVHDSLPERLPDRADAQKAVIEHAARLTLGPQQTPPNPGETPLPPEPRLAGYWPVRFSDLDTLFAQATSPEQESNASASIEAPAFDCASNNHLSCETHGADKAARKSSAPEKDARGTDTAATEYLAALKEALRALRAVNQGITPDTFVQAAADPAYAPEYEKIRKAIIAEATALRNKAQSLLND